MSGVGGILNKLEALGYPNRDKFNIEDKQKIKLVISWLEDLCINKCEPEHRQQLRNIESPEWDKALKLYLAELDGLPSCINLDNLVEVLDWLLNIAIKFAYKDKSSSLQNLRIQSDQSKKGTKMNITSNPFDQFDLNSPEFIEGVQSLAKTLKVTNHSNHLITLEAIAKLIGKIKSVPDDLKTKGEPWPFMEKDMGLESGNPKVINASKILRLLYIHDLRDLQTKINECIVAVQTISANPKTDSRLGQVGTF